MARASLLDPRWRRLGRLRLYCNASCIAAVMVGCLVLVGWILHLEFLKSGLLHSETIKANTALGLILLGVSSWLLLPDPPRRSRRCWGLFFGALLAAIGTMTVIEYAFGLDLHFDQLLFRDDLGALAGQFPGRMAPVTAITFWVLGLALLLVDVETHGKQRPAQLLSLWGGFAGLMSLNGLINGATATYKVFSFAPVNVCTAIVLCAMSGAIFFSRPRAGIAGDLTGRFAGSVMARRFLPAMIVVPIFASWMRVQGQRAGLFGTGLGLAWGVTVNVAIVSLLVWWNARLLNRGEESLEEARKDKDTFYIASLRDELTGLYNRRGFLSLAEEQIKLACSGRRELLVVFADVDGLKAINDQHGHSEGDRALRKAAEVLTAVFRDTDVVARLGGDEFAVLALDCSRSGLVRIRAHFDKMLRIVNDLGNPWKLSISVGTVQVDSRHPLSIEELLDKADAIMYDRKRASLFLVSN